jgi:hypothetical protein
VIGNYHTTIHDVLRIFIGASEEPSRDEVLVIECNLGNIELEHRGFERYEVEVLKGKISDELRAPERG